MEKALSEELKHTPEPWNIHPHYKCEGMAVENDLGEGWVVWSAVIAKGNLIIAETKGNTANGGFPKVENGKEVEANADRIIACVNACAGINPDAVPDLLAFAKRVDANLTGVHGSIEAHPGNVLGCDQWLKEALAIWCGCRAVIAKAEGRVE